MTKRLFGLVMVLFLAAFAAFATGEQETGSMGGEPEEFEVAIFGNERHTATIDGLLDTVRADKPDMSISVITVPWGEYVQKLSVLQLSGDAPDIAWAADTHLQAFLQNDILVDISAIRTDGDSEYDFDDFAPSTLEFVTRDGNLYGLPFSVPPKFIFYNEDRFEAAGLQTPYSLWQEGNWNFETFRETVVELSDKDNGLYGYPSLKPSAFMLMARHFLWGFGAEPFSDDLSEFALDSPEGRDAMQYIWDLYNQYDVLPLPGEIELRAGFNSGRLAMIEGSVSDLNRDEVTGGVEFDWSIAPMPVGPANGPVQMGYAAWAVLNDRHSEETIIDVLKAVSSKEAAIELSQYFLPGRTSVVQSEELAAQYPVDAEVFREVVLGSLEKGRVPRFPENYAQMQNVIQAAVEDMIINDVSAGDTIEAMEQNLQEYFQ